jgi:hypothetical protein
MATIDPNIALGVKPLQVENPMAQYAMLSQLQTGQNQNALAQYQLSAAQRADESTNLKNQLYSQHFNQNTGKLDTKAYYNALAKNPVTAGLIPKEQAAQIELEHKANVNQKNIVDTTTAAIKNIREKASDLQFNPSDDNIRAHAQDAVLHGVWTQAQADQNVKLALALPMDQRPAYFAKQGLDAEKRVVTAETSRANLEREKTAKDTLTETTRSHKVNESIAGGNLAVNQQNANLNREKFAFETNPEKVGLIAEAKKTAELNATDKLAKTKTIEGATQILKDIKYDPKTKDNDVSKLIDISTGSYGGAAINLGNRVFGRSTEGSKAIAELKTIESKITTDLLGGKLGSGISNADRDFIQQQVGLIGDATLPTGDRKAAWSRVVNRLADISSKNSATPGIAPPSGFVPD